MDLVDDSASGNAHEYTVSELAGAVKRVVEGEFGRVRVRGEIGRVFVARSGHIYFDVKDDRSVLASVVWKGQAEGLATRPEEGMEVVATGRVTTFASQSKYQLCVEDLRPAGVGALMAMLEKRKVALEAEGLFDASRKRPLPYLPEIIGVVTSPQGAVIRDILHRLRERFPRRVLVWPVAVQGQASAPEVARAIEGFNALAPGGAVPRPDLLIVARGGGSIEDLWGFNEEIVARAAAASAIPLISAVGHETDTTLIDFVSDRRAPTPTAAAELAVPVRMELLAALDGQAARLSRATGQGVRLRRQRLGDLARALPRPDGLTQGARQRLDGCDLRLPAALRTSVAAHHRRLAEVAGVLRPRALSQRVAECRAVLADRAGRLPPALARGLRDARRRHAEIALPRRAVTRGIAGACGDLGRLSDRLDRAMAERLRERRGRIEALERLRLTLGYEATLVRGYAVVRGDGQVVTGKAEAQAARSLEIQFRDGRLTLGRTPRKPKPTPPEQGTLL